MAGETAKFILYEPNSQPKTVQLDVLDEIIKCRTFLDDATVVALLGCKKELVDLLASGEGYVIYSVFDSEDAVNIAAMAMISDITGVDFAASSDDEVIRGTILLVLF